MKIENLERANTISNELKRLDDAIISLNSVDPNKIGFLISEYQDKSGFFVDYQYKNENYHPMYKDIIEFIQKRFAQAKIDLVNEIESL
jgi:hypothetical protein